NMMGLDQDDIVLAPWTTVKRRVSGSSLASVNQSAASAEQGPVPPGQIYPGQSSLYPVPSQTQTQDTPLPVRFANVDQILVAARSPPDVPIAMRQIAPLLHERHRIREGDPDDFNVRDMTEMTRAMSSTTE